MIDDTENISLWNSDGSLRQPTASNNQSLIAQEFPQEVAQDEEQEEVVEAAPQPEPQPNPQPAPQKKNDAEENFYRLRKRNEELEYEREQLRQQLAQAQKQKAAEDLNLSLNDDDLAEGRHLSKVAQKVKQLEEQLQQTAAINQQLLIEQRIKSKHKDFDEIVTKENLEKLRDEDPEIFNMILSAQDPYAQGVTAYKMIKKLGIVPDTTEPLQRIVQNVAKPKSANSVAGQQSSTALSKAAAFGDLTPELAKMLVKEMNEAANRA